MCMQSNTLIPEYGNNFCKHAFSFCELPMWALLHLWKMIIFARNNPCVCGKKSLLPIYRGKEPIGRVYFNVSV